MTGFLTTNFCRIPDSVKKIGEYAFYKTALKRVEIAEDCEYYITSFPDGCEIVGGVWDNLTDKNDDILEDNSGSEIMVRRVN
jgi:Na+-transporting NADH:ubiquinone oxidoreductase subunit NqrF